MSESSKLRGMMAPLYEGDDYTDGSHDDGERAGLLDAIAAESNPAKRAQLERAYSESFGGDAGGVASVSVRKPSGDMSDAAAYFYAQAGQHEQPQSANSEFGAAAADFYVVADRINVSPVKPISAEQGDFMRAISNYLPQTKEIAGNALAVVGLSAKKMFGEGSFSDLLTSTGLEMAQEAKTRQVNKDTDSFSSAYESGMGAVLSDWLPYQAGQTVGNLMESATAALVGAGIGAVAGGPASPVTATGGAATGFLAKNLLKQSVKDMAEKMLSEQGEDVAKAYLKKEVGKAIGLNSGIAGMAALHGFGETGGRAIEEATSNGGTVDDVDLGRLIPSALAHTGAEFFGDKILLNGFFGDNAFKAAGSGAFALGKTVLGNVAKTGAKEMPVEVFQTGAERFGAGLPLANAEAGREYIDSAAAAGVMGIAGAPGGVRAHFAQDPVADIGKAGTTDEAIAAAERAIDVQALNEAHMELAARQAAEIQRQDAITPLSRESMPGWIDTAAISSANDQRMADITFPEQLAEQNAQRQSEIAELEALIADESVDVTTRRAALASLQAQKREALDGAFRNDTLALPSPNDATGVLRVTPQGEALPETRQQRIEAERAKLFGKYRPGGNADEPGVMPGAIEPDAIPNTGIVSAGLTGADSNGTTGAQPTSVENSAVQLEPAIKQDAATINATLPQETSAPGAATQIQQPGAVSAPTRSQNFNGNLIHDIKQIGGVSQAEFADITGESSLAKIKGAGFVFTKNGQRLDNLVTRLNEIGYNINTQDVDGGVGQLRDMLRDAMNGTPVMTPQAMERHSTIQAANDHRANVIDMAASRGLKPGRKSTAQIEAELRALDERDAQIAAQQEAEEEAFYNSLIDKIDASDGVSSKGMTDADIDSMFGLEETYEQGHAEARIAASQAQAGQVAAGAAGAYQGTAGHPSQETQADSGAGGFNLSGQSEAEIAAEAAKPAPEFIPPAEGFGLTQPEKPQSIRDAEGKAKTGDIFSQANGAAQGGNVKPFSEVRRYLEANVFGKEKGSEVPDVTFEVGYLSQATIADIAKFIDGFSEKHALVRVSGKSLKHTDEQRHAELDSVIDSLPLIIKSNAEVLHNPTRENSAFVVYESDNNYLVVLEIAKNGNGTDVVNVITTRDRGLKKYREKSAEWLDGRRSHHPVNQEVPAEGEISVFQPIGDDNVAQSGDQAKQSAIASIKQSDIPTADKVRLAAELRKGEVTPDDVAAIVGEPDHIDDAGKVIEPAQEAESDAAAQQDDIDMRISNAEQNGVVLSDDDKVNIRAAFEKAAELQQKADRIAGRSSDPMNKGNAFPMGVGFTKMTKRLSQRIDSSVKRAGEAVAIFGKSSQAKSYAEALLSGKGTEADKIHKAAKKEESQRSLVNKLLTWKKGDKIGPYTIERVNNDRDGYPASYTISGDGIIKGVWDKVDVAKEFFGGSKDAFRRIVDDVRDAGKSQESNKESDQGIALLSRSPWVNAGRRVSFATADAVVRRVVAAKKSWNVEIGAFATFDALPSDVQKAAIKDYGEKDARQAKGIVHNGKVYIVSENNESEADVESTVLHEVEGHIGVHRLYGKEIVNKLNSLFELIGGRDGLKRIVKQRAIEDDIGGYALALDKNQRLTDDQKISVLMDEVLAHYAQDPKFSDRIKAIVGMIRAKLRELGFKHFDEYGETDLLHVLKQGRAQLKTNHDGVGGVTSLMVAWHGSPHDHNKFDSSKIGTGEGAQAYGYGHYFASNREVAEYYKSVLSDKPKDLIGSYIEYSAKYGRMKGEQETSIGYLKEQGLPVELAPFIDRAINGATLSKDGTITYSNDAMAAFRELDKKFTTKGKLYQVELAPDADEYLDWDKPLSEQSEKVKSAFKKFVSDFGEAYPIVSDSMQPFENTSGEGLYRAFVSDSGTAERASKDLHSIGIRGIRYLDGNSRSAGEGNSNYVIFNDSDVSITEKYSRTEYSEPGLTTARIQSIVDSITAKLPRLSGVAHVVQSANDLPDGGMYSDTEGAYLGDTGEIYLVADNLPTEQRVREVLAHEAIGHLAMEEMLGAVDPKLWGKLVQQITTLEQSGNALIKRLAAQVDESQPGLGRTMRVKEMLAMMAEHEMQNDPQFIGAARSVFQRFIDGIKAFMKLVFGVQMSDKEVLEIVKMAERHLGEKAGESSVVSGMKQAMASRSSDDKFLTEAWKLLAGNDLMFKYPRSDSKDMMEIFDTADNDLVIEHAGGDADLEDAWMVYPKDKDGEPIRNKPGFVLLYKDGSVEINVLQLGEGNAGSAVYAAVGNYAFNNGIKFKGDRMGISPIGIYRRLENMISLALKFGTTDFLEPHPDQLSKLGIDWKDGETDHNLDEMLNASYRHAAKQFPYLKEVTYDFGSHEFRDSAGNRVVVEDPRSANHLEGVQRPSGEGQNLVARARAEGLRTGEATLKRALFTQSFLASKDNGSVRGKILEQLRDWSRGELVEDYVDIAYSRTRIVGDSGRRYTAEQQAAMGRTGSTVTSKTIQETARSLWQDAGKKLAQGIVDQFRPVRDLSAHAYTLMRLSKGATGAFEAFMHHGKLSLRDGAYDAETSGGALETVFYPLGKESTDFLRWIAGNRAERLAKEGKENLFTPEDIAAFKSLADGTTDFDYTLPNGKITRDRTLIYRDSLQKFNAFNQNVLDMAEQSGLIDTESRNLWEHEFYVPFYRAADEDNGGVRGMNIKSGVVRQEAFKKLKGGEQQLNDLLENTLMNWAHLIDAGAKNRAATATLQAAVKVGAARPAIYGEKKTVWHMDNGQKVEYKVEDPYLMEAISSLEYAGLRGPAMDAMSTMKHWLTIGVTASPYFKVRNLIRDSVQAIATSELGYNPLENVRRGYKLTERSAQEYVSALAGGGLIRFGTMLEGSEAKRTRQLIKQGASDQHILDDEGKMRTFYDKYLEPAVSAYNEIGNRGEEINRMALYDALIKKGTDHATASLMARDLMDFSMQGTWGTVRFLTQIVPFMNARLQGLYKLGRAANEDKQRFAIVLGGVAMASLALLAAYSDDDDWKKREDWDRNNYWWFKFGGQAFRIPKPFEIGAIATLAERSAELVFDNEMTGERFRKIMGQISGDQLAMNPTPQAFKPIIDLYANHDSFTGRAIESMGMERLAPSHRYKQSTSLVARGISSAGNALTGDHFLSPVQVDHVMRAYFGWLGSFTVGAADMMVRSAADEPTRPALDYWKTATGGMVSELEGERSRYVSQMYDQARELEQAYGTWNNLRKEGKTEEAQAYREDHQDELSRYRRVEAVKRQESRINERIRMIERSTMNSDSKKERINVLRQRQDMIARQLSA